MKRSSRGTLGLILLVLFTGSSWAFSRGNIGSLNPLEKTQGQVHIKSATFAVSEDPGFRLLTWSDSTGSHQLKVEDPEANNPSSYPEGIADVTIQYKEQRAIIKAMTNVETPNSFCFLLPDAQVKYLQGQKEIQSIEGRTKQGDRCQVRLN